MRYPNKRPLRCLCVSTQCQAHHHEGRGRPEPAQRGCSASPCFRAVPPPERPPEACGRPERREERRSVERQRGSDLPSPRSPEIHRRQRDSGPCAHGLLLVGFGAARCVGTLGPGESNREAPPWRLLVEVTVERAGRRGREVWRLGGEGYGQCKYGGGVGLSFWVGCWRRQVLGG